MTTPVKVTVVENTLSDGSHTYDVHLGKAVFPCVDLRHAENCAEAIAKAITDYSLERGAIGWKRGERG